MALYDIYAIVHGAMAGIMILPVSILWLIFVFKARRRGDPARTAFTWAKAFMPAVAIAYLFDLISDTFFVVESNSRSTRRITEEVYLRTAVLGNFFERLSSILLIITIVELGNGFMYVATHKPAAYRKILFFASLGAAVLLLALAIAQLAKANATYNRYLNWIFSDDFDFDDDLSNDFDLLRRLGGAVDILAWIVSIPLIAYGGVVVHTHRQNPSIRNSASLFLTVTILNFIRHLWLLIFTATFLLNPGRLGTSPEFSPVIDGIFNVWFLFIIAVMIFALGIRKHNGLWTTSQPWTIGVPQPHPPAHQGHVYAQPQMPIYGGTAYQQYGQPALAQGQQPSWQPGQQPVQWQPQPPPGQVPVHIYNPQQQELHQQQQRQFQQQQQPQQQQTSPPYSDSHATGSPPPASTPAPEVHAKAQQPVHEVKG